jgi:hypothetical protein
MQTVLQKLIQVLESLIQPGPVIPAAVKLNAGSHRRELRSTMVSGAAQLEPLVRNDGRGAGVHFA